MEQPRMTTEEVASVISNWYFERTDLGESGEEALREEKEELKRQQRQLEAQKQEFLRAKTFEEKRLEREKNLFEMKWKMLEEEWRKLVVERERVERKRSFYERMEDFEQSERRASCGSVSVLFRGVKNASALKKRYKELIKIFHPDNAAGDTGVIQEINKEYENLKLSMAKNG